MNRLWLDLFESATGSEVNNHPKNSWTFQPRVFCGSLLDVWIGYKSPNILKSLGTWQRRWTGPEKTHHEAANITTWLPTTPIIVLLANINTTGVSTTNQFAFGHLLWGLQHPSQWRKWRKDWLVRGAQWTEPRVVSQESQELWLIKILILGLPVIADPRCVGLK